MRRIVNAPGKSEREKSKTPELVGLREFARRKGVTLTTVQEALARGRISFVVIDGNKRIDADKAMKEWDDNTDPNFQVNLGVEDDSIEGKTTASKAASTFAESRAVREAYSARITKLEYEQKLGSLVNLADVKKEVFELARNTRNLVLNIPPKIAAELAAETDPHKVEKILAVELRKALEGLSRGRFS